MQYWNLVLGLSCLVSAVGCGRDPDRVAVHGVIRYRGEPLPYGSVMFQPPGGAALARSPIGPNGTFELVSDGHGPGVEPGLCRVRITAYELQHQPTDAAQRIEEPKLGRSMIPQHYQNFGTSGLEIDVHPEMRLPLEINLE